jgi:hypothetical protein
MASKTTAPGTTARAMIAEAKPVAVPPTVGPDLGQPLNGIPPGAWKEHADAYGMPPDCPVLPLGVQDGTIYLLDAIGQIRTLPEPYGKGHILGLFLGDDRYLSWAWDRRDRHNHVEGFEAMKAAATLLQAGKLKGIWNGAEKIRGRGVWRSRRGELILHLGDDLWQGLRPLSAQELDGYVYPARPGIPRPWHEKIDIASSPVRLLLPMLRSWNWERADVDPVLLLGWLGAARLGAALPWRPTAFITGDKGTGKSTLQELIKLLSDGGLVHAADTSAAGIYQRIGQDCLPVAIDELESEADFRKQKAVLKLARLAASGALMLRGGDRHQGVEFQARSCFLFSSINTPPLEPQDLSRMAILRLRRLPQGARKPVLDPQTCAIAGSMIFRRLIEEWPRFSETLAAFQGELAEGGMDSRGQDTFGVLLTCADLILYEGWNEERLRWPTESGELVPWRELMNVDTMIEFEDQAENWRLCLDHMLSVPVEAWRNGTRKTVGQVLNDYYQKSEDMGLSQARLLLAQAGLTIVMREEFEHYLDKPWLAVPNQSPLTRTLFLGSKWAGDLGGSVWTGALRQAPPELCQPGRAKINGVTGRVTLIALRGLYGSEGLMKETADANDQS